MSSTSAVAGAARGFRHQGADIEATSCAAVLPVKKWLTLAPQTALAERYAGGCWWWATARAVSQLMR